MNHNDWRDYRAFIFAGVLLFVVVLVVGGMATLGIGLFKKETADFRGGVAATEQVHANGAYRIAAYDQFFNRCAEIQSKEATIAFLTTEAKDATPDRVAQINSTLTAVRAGRAADIARYNADAAKTDTLANFLASSLPYSIDPTQDHTTCAK